jgi:hypothetical protein
MIITFWTSPPLRTWEVEMIDSEPIRISKLSGINKRNPYGVGADGKYNAQDWHLS